MNLPLRKKRQLLKKLKNLLRLSLLRSKLSKTSQLKFGRPGPRLLNPGLERSKLHQSSLLELLGLRPSRQSHSRGDLMAQGLRRSRLPDLKVCPEAMAVPEGTEQEATLLGLIVRLMVLGINLVDLRCPDHRQLMAQDLATERPSELLPSELPIRHLRGTVPDNLTPLTGASLGLLLLQLLDVEATAARLLRGTANLDRMGVNDTDLGASVMVAAAVAVGEQNRSTN